ncbi:MAG: SWIM zinc finger domain-containing protein [Gemmiger sp.]|nr:SWIM zinc finger domain-containing protein [Gemmiger sp.]
MGILSCASNASAWRGYEYYIDKKVITCQQTAPDIYEGEVKGSSSDSYQVKIDIVHSRKSKCNCPHANGTRIVCKHMVALFFTAFPEEAVAYKAEVDQYEADEEKRIQEHYDELEKRINSLSKKQLQEELLAATIELEEARRAYW